MFVCVQESKGYVFESETDTETIAKLVKYMYDNRENDDITFATLVEQVTKQLVNTFSVTLTIDTLMVMSNEGKLCGNKHLLYFRKELLSWSSKVCTIQERQWAAGNVNLNVVNIHMCSIKCINAFIQFNRVCLWFLKTDCNILSNQIHKHKSP